MKDHPVHLNHEKHYQYQHQGKTFKYDALIFQFQLIQSALAFHGK